MSGLDFQLVDIRFEQGLDTRTDKKLRIPGKWETLKNYSLAPHNTPQRRDGMAVTVLGTFNSLATHDNELLAISGQSMSSLSTANNTNQAVATPGVVGFVGVEKTSIIRGLTNQDSPDCATGAGYTCYVWRELDATSTAVGLRVTLVDEATGARLISNAQLRSTATVKCPRVVYNNGAFFIFYSQVPQQLYCRTILTSTPTVLNAEQVLINSANLSAVNFDATAFGSQGGNTPFATIAYGWTDGTTSVRASTVTHTLGVPAISTTANIFTQAQVQNATICAIAICPFSNLGDCGVFALSTAGTMAGIAGASVSGILVVTGPTQLDATAPPVVGPCHLTATPVAPGTGNLQVFADQQSSWGTANFRPLRTVTMSSGAVAAGAYTMINSSTFRRNAAEAAGPQGPFIAGKAFTFGGAAYLPVCMTEAYGTLTLALTPNTANANTQNSWFLLDVLGQVVAKALYGQYGVVSTSGTQPSVSTPCSQAVASSGVFSSLVEEQNSVELDANVGNVSPSGLSRLDLSPNATVAAIKKQLGGSTFIAGGSLVAYDGSIVVEHGFNMFPEGVSAVLTAAGGNMTAGSHQVCVVSEWVDGAGQRHQSAPSIAVAVTVAANDRISLLIPTLQLTQIQKANVRFVPYATLAGGTIFYRCNNNNGVFAPVLNSFAASTVAFIIADADATLGASETLYTQPDQAGTELPNDSPPPNSALTVAQNRLWMDAGDDPGAFWYSQEFIPGVGLQFSVDLVGRVPTTAGGITGLSPLDEKVVIFCKRKIYVIFGTGPTTSGGFNNYSEPQELPSDVGCIEPRSILLMPTGILFKAQKGWYLLGRDLSAVYVGEGVAEFDSYVPTSAVLLEDRLEARITTVPTNGTSVNFSYAYLTGQWSTWAGYEGGSQRMADAIWWATPGLYMMTSATTGITQDTPFVYEDQPAGGQGFIAATTAKTGWLRVNSIEGYQRVREVYLTATTSSLTGAGPTTFLTVTVDFDDIYGGPNSYNFTVNLASIIFAGTIDITHRLRHQKCKSVAFKFVETSIDPDADIPLLGIQALTLEVGVKKGTNKLQASQSVD